MTNAPIQQTEPRWRLDFSLGEVAAIAGGVVVQGPPERRVDALFHDTREPVHGALFVALKGESFDGHDYLKAAIEAGAGAVLVSQATEGVAIPPDRSVVRVHDTLEALGRLACARRVRRAIPVVAVAGSSGKTTTKDMIAAVIGSERRVLKTPGNWNNLIGLPLTLLELRDHHEVAVVEVGMNQPGELRKLTQIASPTTGVLVNVGLAHLGMFNNETELLRAKGEFVEGLPSSARLFYNADCERSRHIVHLFGGLRPRFGVGEASTADYRLLGIETRPAGYSFQLKAMGHLLDLEIAGFGRYNTRNAAMAAAVALDFGLESRAIRQALRSFRSAGMRSEVIRSGGVTLIVDCYNANPASMFAALESLGEIPLRGRRFAVLGDMLELGEMEKELHARIGRHFAVDPVEWLVTSGDLARETSEAAAMTGQEAWHAETVDEIAPALARRLVPGDAVLFKASRGMRLERAVEALREILEADTAARTDDAQASAGQQ